MLPFRKILWAKSVSLEEDVFAYPGRPRQRFALHCTPEDADSLSDPEVDDLIVLTQHDLVTHIVRVIDREVTGRPRRTIRKGTRDERFSMQRLCEHVIVRDFDEAPPLEESFGCDVDTSGGETWRIEHLGAVLASDQPLWMVQKRIQTSLEGPSMRALYATRAERWASTAMPEVSLQEFLRDDDDA